METTQVFPIETWFQIYNHCTNLTLLNLWKTNIFFKETLTPRLQIIKRKLYGIDLYAKDVPIIDSLLTTYRVLEDVNNMLLSGIYHLRSNIECKLPTGEALFLLFGDIRFNVYTDITEFRNNLDKYTPCHEVTRIPGITNTFTFHVYHGILFRLYDCHVHDSSFYIQKHVDISDEMPELIPINSPDPQMEDMIEFYITTDGSSFDSCYFGYKDFTRP